MKSHLHVRDKSRLRTVTKSTFEKFPSIFPGDKICDSCRKKLSSVSVIAIPSEKVEFLSQSVGSSETDYCSASTTASPVKEFQASVANLTRERANEYF